MNAKLYKSTIAVAANLFAALTIVIFGCVHSNADENNLSALVIREVTIAQNNDQKDPNFVQAKELYPDYQFYLPDDLLVRKKPAFQVFPKSIKEIKITQPPWVPKNSTNYEVQIGFKKDIFRDLYDFTKGKLNQKVALEVDAKLFMIVNVMEPIGDSMVIPTVELTVDELMQILQKLKNDISLD